METRRPRQRERSRFYGKVMARYADSISMKTVRRWRAGALSKEVMRGFEWIGTSKWAKTRCINADPGTSSGFMVRPAAAPGRYQCAGTLGHNRRLSLCGGPLPAIQVPQKTTCLSLFPDDDPTARTYTYQMLAFKTATSDRCEKLP